MRCRWNFPDCPRSVWKWASVLLFFTLSLMCDFTNGSCFIAAGTQKERCEADLWQSLSWVAEHSVTYLMSIMHLCCVLCLLWREPHNIIHNAWIMTGHKNPSIHAGGRKESINYVENWLVSTSLSSQQSTEGDRSCLRLMSSFMKVSCSKWAFPVHPLHQGQMFVETLVES